MRLQFNAVTNRSYTLEYREAAGAGVWTGFTNIAPVSAPQLIRVTNEIPAGAATRFYRLRTP